MSIEKDLSAIAQNTGRIADALEALLSSASGLAAGVAAQATVQEPEPEKQAASTGSRRQAKNHEREDKAPEEPKPEEPPASDPLDDAPTTDEATFTEEEVRKALKTYRDIEGSAATMAILAKFGADGMGSLKPEHYAGVMKEVR